MNRLKFVKTYNNNNNKAQYNIRILIYLGVCTVSHKCFQISISNVNVKEKQILDTSHNMNLQRM